jgi:hypothetical protein
MGVREPHTLRHVPRHLPYFKFRYLVMCYEFSLGS